ncbi:MAG: ParB N-terminal domain-containing protein [Pseudomonadota bacterium]
MAKRRKLEAPSAEELKGLEAELGRNRPERPAPIAQVAADASTFAPVSDPRDISDAKALRAAREAGRLIEAVPLKEIDEHAMIRDRIVLDAIEMRELRSSIQQSGVRLPIELFPLEEPEKGGARYGLISGYRRFLAVSELFEMTELPEYAVIPALIVRKSEGAEAMVRMVEENEVRVGLSPFERGRIAVVAANQGLYENAQAAVDGLFPVASKSKRSKIRSFALIFEELGDLLVNGDQMQERQGLRLSQALREVGDAPFRDALEEVRNPKTFGEEWEALEPVVAEIELGKTVADVPKPGRAKPTPPGPEWKRDTMRLASGFVLTRYTDGADQLIRISGRPTNEETGTWAMEAIKRAFDLP